MNENEQLKSVIEDFKVYLLFDYLAVALCDVFDLLQLFIVTS